MIRSTLILVLLFLQLSSLNAQLLTMEQVTSYPLKGSEEIEADLLKSDWKKNNVQFVPDSNFVRRSWVIHMKETDIKSYVLHYEFTKDPGENYVIYQFPDRSAYKKFKKDIVEMGYKQLNGGKSRKKSRSKDENIHKEKEELFYNEKTKRLTVIKEVFFYGLFSFLVYSYQPNAAMAEHVMHPKVPEGGNGQ